MGGCVACLLSIGEPEGFISGEFTKEVPARSAIEHSPDTHNTSFFGDFFILFVEILSWFTATIT